MIKVSLVINGLKWSPFPGMNSQRKTTRNESESDCFSWEEYSVNLICFNAHSETLISISRIYLLVENCLIPWTNLTKVDIFKEHRDKFKRRRFGSIILSLRPQPVLGLWVPAWDDNVLHLLLSYQPPCQSRTYGFSGEAAGFHPQSFLCH